MPLAKGQVELDGLLLGPGTSYKVRAFNPWIRSVRADAMGDIPQGHGSYSGPEYREHATVPIRVVVMGVSSGTWHPLHQDLARALDAVGTSGDKVLRFRTGGVDYRMYGRPRMVEPDIRDLETGYILTAGSFVALDPKIYSDAEHLIGPLGLPTTSGGLTLSFTVPFSIGSTLTGGIAEDLANVGNLEAPLRIRFDGPLESPWVVLNRSDGLQQTARVNVTLGVGEWVEVDAGRRTVLLNGTTSRYGSWSGDWLSIPSRGTADLLWRAANNSAAGTLRAWWRDTW